MNLSERIYHKVVGELQILPYRVFRLLDKFNNLLLIKYNPPKSVIYQLEKIECRSIFHMERNLLEHFQGTYQLLKKWGNSESICLAGLCHAIYGTETFPVALVPLQKRKEIALIIGDEAEKLVYYYFIITRKHFINNLTDSDKFTIKSRLNEEIIEITKLEFSQLLEIFLADRLEQILSLHYSDRYEYKKFFEKNRSFLSRKAFDEFAIAYSV